MGAAILAIGDELLCGAGCDTNSAWLAGELLRERGIPLERVEICRDDLPAIRAGLERLLAGGGPVLVTGGLGPTEDDRTREAVAGLAGVGLVADPEGRVALERRLAERGLPWSEPMARQVLIPQGFEALANPVGQALGLAGRIEGVQLFALPGVPAEMRGMFTAEVLPRLARAGECCLIELCAMGEPEAAMGERIGDLMRAAEPVVGVTVNRGVVTVRIQAFGAGARERAEETARRAERQLGPTFMGRGKRSLEDIVGGLLVAEGVTLATAESCTGGLLAARLVAWPGISAVFQGGFVCYANQAKEEWVGVPRELLEAHGAVSGPVAQALARGAAERAGARLGVGITGIAGPGGAVEGKPVGTVHIAAWFDGAPVGERRHTFRGDRQDVREWAAAVALRLIYQVVRDRKM